MKIIKWMVLIDLCFFEVKNLISCKTVFSSFPLPDEDDRHVLAAAIRCKADVIVTFNLKHFPSNDVGEFDIEAQHPDVFVSNLIDLNPERLVAAF